MSLRQAIKGLIVVAAVMFGASASAFAHAGHPHAQSSASPAIPALTSAVSGPVAPQSVADISGAVARSSSTQLDEPGTSERSFRSAGFHTEGTACPPGACCCQGASTCSMGSHCCTSMMPDHASWASDLSDHMRYHLARLGWVYPDIVIGLDRPPKA